MNEDTELLVVEILIVLLDVELAPSKVRVEDQGILFVEEVPSHEDHSDVESQGHTKRVDVMVFVK